MGNNIVFCFVGTNSWINSLGGDEIMALTNLLPRTINTTGASATGSDGALNRTYSLPDSGVVSSGLDLTVSGTSLHEGAGNDFTLADNVITFLNALWDDSEIRINYFITFGAPSSSTLSSTTDLKYATPLMLAEILGVEKSIPSWDVAGTPIKENVGTGNNSTTTFYLDQKSVISDSYTLYYGATEASVTALTETTHYNLDNDTGTLVLTSAGVTLVSTSKIFASYKYYSDGMKDSYIVSVLSRAEKKVNNETNSIFTDGTQDNPSYPIKTEIQSSPGYFRNQIIVDDKPFIDVTSKIDGDITSSDSTISITGSTGANFPSSGYIIINSEVITYTGVSTDDLTGCTRGVLGTTAAAHSDGDDVHTTILFLSNTQQGTTRVYTVQPWDTQMHITETGLAYSYNQSVFNESQFPDRLSEQDVADRVKIIYYHGYNTVPTDITRLTLIFAKEMLLKDSIGSSLIKGRDGFRPGVMSTDAGEAESIINSYIVIPMGNT